MTDIIDVGTIGVEKKVRIEWIGGHRASTYPEWIGFVRYKRCGIIGSAEADAFIAIAKIPVVSGKILGADGCQGKEGQHNG